MGARLPPPRLEATPQSGCPHPTSAGGVVVPRATALRPVPVGVSEVACVPATRVPLKVTGDLWGWAGAGQHTPCRTPPQPRGGRETCSLEWASQGSLEVVPGGPLVGRGQRQGRPVSFLVATVGLQSFMNMSSSPAPCWPGPFKSTRPTNSSFVGCGGGGGAVRSGLALCTCPPGWLGAPAPQAGCVHPPPRLTPSPGKAGGVPQAGPCPPSRPRCRCLGPATPAPGSRPPPRPAPGSLEEGVAMGQSALFTPSRHRAHPRAGQRPRGTVAPGERL